MLNYKTVIVRYLQPSSRRRVTGVCSGYIQPLCVYILRLEEEFGGGMLSDDTPFPDLPRSPVEPVFIGWLEVGSDPDRRACPDGYRGGAVCRHVGAEHQRQHGPWDFLQHNSLSEVSPLLAVLQPFSIRRPSLQGTALSDLSCCL